MENNTFDMLVNSIYQTNSFREVKIKDNSIEFLFLTTLYVIKVNEENNYNIKLFTHRAPGCISMESLKLYERDIFTVIHRLREKISTILSSDEIMIVVDLEDGFFTLEALDIFNR